jgi:hypothetical protein
MRMTKVGSSPTFVIRVQRSESATSFKTPAPGPGTVLSMTVAEFDTKCAVVVRDDLAAWQRLNVTAFLMSGLVAQAGAGPGVIGEDYIDGDGHRYLPLLVQPVLVFETGGGRLRTLRERAARREVPVAIYTADMFTTGNDADNRAAVRAVATADLDLVGLGVRAGHRDVDAIVRGAGRHP